MQGIICIYALLSQKFSLGLIYFLKIFVSLLCGVIVTAIISMLVNGFGNLFLTLALSIIQALVWSCVLIGASAGPVMQ